MKKRFFIKYSPAQAFVSRKGKLMKFPDFENGYGGVATEDPALIEEFTFAIQQSRGGLAEVSEKEFEDIKKKEISSPNSKPFTSLQDLARAAAPRRHAAAAPKHPDMITVPAVGGPIQIPAAKPAPSSTSLKPKGVRR